MNIQQLNEFLGAELGRVPGGSEPLFKWEWSEDLFWPSYATGGRVEKQSPGGIVYFEKEYRRDRMSHKLRKQWVVTKWCRPEELSQWKENFPGADYPANGYRINTDWYNPPGKQPTFEDTRCLVWAIRKQFGMTAGQLADDVQAEQDHRDKAVENEVLDEIREDFTAFMNPYPGKRGGSISFGGVDKEKPNGATAI